MVRVTASSKSESSIFMAVSQVYDGGGVQGFQARWRCHRAVLQCSRSLTCRQRLEGAGLTLADEILNVLLATPQGLSDADLAGRLGKSHQHVNQTCARLAAQGRIERDASDRPILNRALDAQTGPRQDCLPRGAVAAKAARRPVPRSAEASGSVESVMWIERPFTLVGALAVDRDQAGQPLAFMPQALYAKAGLKVLNRHGTGPFCRFRLPAAPPGAGVYVVTEDGLPVYVGICENLARRWGQSGYGSISPVNCFVGGQSTNCKINARILAGSVAGRVYEVWFHETEEGRRAIEVEAIRVLAPAWNGTR